jgi:hypothetical protein
MPYPEENTRAPAPGIFTEREGFLLVRLTMIKIIIAAAEIIVLITALHMEYIASDVLSNGVVRKNLLSTPPKPFKMKTPI